MTKSTVPVTTGDKIENIKIFDFTGGNEIYKSLWNNNKFEIYESLKANSLKGKIIILLMNLKNILSKISFLKIIYYYLKKKLNNK